MKLSRKRHDARAFHTTWFAKLRDARYWMETWTDDSNATPVPPANHSTAESTNVVSTFCKPARFSTSSVTLFARLAFLTAAMS